MLDRAVVSGVSITEFCSKTYKFTDDTVSFTHSAPKINVNTHLPSFFPDDVVVGVGILMSERGTHANAIYETWRTV